MTSKIASTAILLFSVTIFLALACTSSIQPDLARHHFSLGEASFTISLPSDFQRDPDVARVKFLRPNHRVVRSLRFTDDLPRLTESHHQIPLNQGGKLNYDIVTYGGGSGGIEAELVGHIMLSQGSIGVIATDQDEFSPNPEWCIAFLHTLERK